MFQSLKHQKCGNFDTVTHKQLPCHYMIIDSDFEEVGSDNMDGLGLIIDIYEKRNLNVAANLTQAILYLEKYFARTIIDIIKENKKNNPKFSKYEKDIEKYLILI
jgi:hypothetical protein